MLLVLLFENLLIVSPQNYLLFGVKIQKMSYNFWFTLANKFTFIIQMAQIILINLQIFIKFSNIFLPLLMIVFFMAINNSLPFFERDETLLTSLTLSIKDKPEPSQHSRIYAIIIWTIWLHKLFEKLIERMLLINTKSETFREQKIFLRLIVLNQFYIEQ